MKKFILNLILLMAVTVLVVLHLENKMAGSWMNKGSTEIIALAFNVLPSTAVDMNAIEQVGNTEISPQGSTMMTNTTQMLLQPTVQWRNSNNLNSGLDVKKAIMDLETAVPSVFPNSGVSELLNESGNSLDGSNNLTALDESIAMPRVWSMTENTPISFAGATIITDDPNAMHNPATDGKTADLT